MLLPGSAQELDAGAQDGLATRSETDKEAMATRESLYLPSANSSRPAFPLILLSCSVSWSQAPTRSSGSGLSWFAAPAAADLSHHFVFGDREKGQAADRAWWGVLQGP